MRAGSGEVFARAGAPGGKGRDESRCRFKTQERAGARGASKMRRFPGALIFGAIAQSGDKHITTG
jgi:hypothetical protein